MKERNSTHTKTSKKAGKSKSKSISSKSKNKGRKYRKIDEKEIIKKGQDIGKSNRKKIKNEEIGKNCKEQRTTEIKGRFKKGQSGNPNGRPKGSKNKYSIKKLTEALEKFAGTISDDETAYDQVARQFYADNHVLVAVLKKLLPDLKSMEAKIETYSSDDSERMDEIRKEYAERFE